MLKGESVMKPLNLPWGENGASLHRTRPSGHFPLLSARVPFGNGPTDAEPKCGTWTVTASSTLKLASRSRSTGHSNPRVVKAIQDQAEKFIHISSDFYHDSGSAWLKTWHSIAPWKGSVELFYDQFRHGKRGSRHQTGARLPLRQHPVHLFSGRLFSQGARLGRSPSTASKANYKKGGFFPPHERLVHVPFPNPYAPAAQQPPGMGDGETVVHYIERRILGHLCAWRRCCRYSD